MRGEQVQTFLKNTRSSAWLIVAAALCGSQLASAEAPPTTFGYQPMVSDGLAAKRPFEAWLWLDKSSDPGVPGYAVPAGATIRLRFPDQFTPQAGIPLAAVMLHGWSQGAISAQFTVAADSADPRTIVIHYDQEITPGPPEKPGLKAIHVRTNVLNPPVAGDYPVTVEFVNAGSLSGTSKAVAHVTAAPVPNIAAYNQLHQGRNEDWQHVRAGEETALPIDLLLNLPGDSRSAISLRPAEGGALAILRDGKPIGLITATGVPVTLAPEAFGPGYARLGIVRVHAKAGAMKGPAEIVASLDGGTQYTIHVVVD